MFFDKGFDCARADIDNIKRKIIIMELDENDLSRQGIRFM